MIRRISNKNDYIDIVRSCPSGVIDDIYEVEYYVDGYSSVYSASFSKKGSLLEVIIPSSALQTLPSGLLMRRAKYRNEDPSFPDGNYDLEFVEDMNVWLESGSVEPGPGPEPGEYLTADDLKTINNESLVGEGNIQIDPGVPAQTFTEHVIGNIQSFSELDSRVTALEQNPGGVSQEQFDAHVAQNGAQFSGIHQSLSNLSQGVQQAQDTASSAASQAAQANQRAVQAIQANAAQDARMDAIDAKNAEQDDRLTALEQSPGGVSQAQFDAHVVANNESFNILQVETRDQSQRIDALENAGFATQQDLDAVAQNLQDVDNKADEIQNQVDGLDQRVSVLEHGGSPSSVSWGGIAGTITDQSDLMNEFDADRSRLDDLENSGFVTEQWVDNKLMTDGYLTEYMADQRYPTFSWIESGGFATESWVSEQGYAVNDPNDPFITESVLTDVLAGDDNRVLREDDLGPYAQMSWVQGQGYLTSSSTLPADQITCNISGDVFDFENVDAGLTALVSRVEDQIDDIASLNNSVSALNGSISTLNGSVSTLDGRVTALEQGGGGGGSSWGSITGNIQAQTDLMNEFDSRDSEITYLKNNCLYLSSVWTGTEAQWNQLSAAQKANYIIALITQ